MRFLIHTKLRQVPPPEMAPALLEGSLEWLRRYKEAGKIEQAWELAGMLGGGGIGNVDSAEELDDLMREWPYQPLVDIEIYPLADLERSWQKALELAKARLGQAG